jgi:hypothetical protein
MMNVLARMAGPTYGTGDEAASTRALVRAARQAAGSAGDLSEGESLETRYAMAGAPARIAPAAPLEDGSFVRAVPGVTAPEFAAFLDGVQNSRAAAWLSSGVPIVVASVGAVILERVGGNLTTWENGIRVQRVLLAPRGLVDDAVWASLGAAGHLEDTRADPDDRHPDALLLRAVHVVESLRAAQECALAELWVAQRREPLYVDGGLSALGAASRSPFAIGVVKSHRTIHVEASRLPELFALGEGERTPVRSVAAAHRASVWTWYLRLRAATASDPLHGLARIEVAPQDGGVTARADEVSRWVLAERTPIALPDARWDVLSYGIARCEAYLKRGLALHGTGGRT